MALITGKDFKNLKIELDHIWFNISKTLNTNFYSKLQIGEEVKVTVNNNNEITFLKGEGVKEDNVVSNNHPSKSNNYIMHSDKMFMLSSYAKDIAVAGISSGQLTVAEAYELWDTQTKKHIDMFKELM